MSERQRTIINPIVLQGIGLHTGCKVTMTLLSAPENHGYKFQRVDLEDKPIIDACVSNVTDTARGTVIEKDGARVSTIEHTLAALRGLGIDNVLIQVTGPEAPILDGSSKLIVEAIDEDNIQEQEAEREYFEIKKKMMYRDEEKGIEIIALPDDKFSANVLISYDSLVLGNQFATMNDLSEFKDEFSPCRTFVFVRELEFLLAHNLVKGGDLDNAIVIMDKKLKQDELDRIADLFNHKHIEINKEGVLNNIDLHFDNEPARHKLLDVIGDLALVGKPIKGRIIATRPGHTANVEFGKVLRKELNRLNSKTTAPEYDSTKEPVLDINQVRDLLPHRYPFLMVDKVMEMKKDSIIGIKNISVNEPHFTGHFPEEPVFPGVLQVEAMAQVGGLLVLNMLPDIGYSTYFMKMDNIKFRQKVVPGDTLVIKVEMMSELRRGIASMKGYIFVGDKLVSEGEFMAQLVKK